MTDIYHDLPGNALSLANVWLRKRSGVWELKVGRTRPDAVAPTNHPPTPSKNLIGRPSLTLNRSI